MQNQTNNFGEVREWRENVHTLLHQNLDLLRLKHPMHPDFAERFVEGMFKKPNSKTFNLCAFYLMSVIDSQCITSDLALFMCEPKLITRFRREFSNFIGETIKAHGDYVSPVSPSWLVTAGGHKAAKLMFELSQVALKVSLQNDFGNKNNPESTKTIKSSVENLCSDTLGKLEKEVATKTRLLSKYNRKIKEIADIYRRQIELTEINTEDKMNMLKKYVQNVKKKIGEDDQDLNGILDVKTPSILLQKWDASIEERVSNIEKRWSESSKNLIDISKTCKKTCEEVLQRYTKQSNEDILLEYNPTRDKFGSYTNDIIKDNVLHFPSLFKVFNSLLYQNFAALTHLKIDPKYCVAVKNKLDALNAKHSESEKLIETMSDLHSELSVNDDFIVFNHTITEKDKWIVDALNIPAL